MANAVKTIGVLTSGGDAPGMNAAIRAVVRQAVTDLLLSVVTVHLRVHRSYPHSVSIQSVFPEQSTLILHVRITQSVLIQQLIQQCQQLTR